MKPFLRHLFRDRRALANYVAGRLLAVDDLQREIGLLEREDNPRRPEHLLTRAASFVLPAPGASLTVLLNGVLRSLAEEHLKAYGDPPLHVRRERFEDWQELLTDCPPIVLVARALLLHQEHALPSPDADHRAVVRFLDAVVLRQVRHSVLPTVFDARLDRVIEREGLDELHMHLNGATEVETVWLDALARPRQFSAEFIKSLRRCNVSLQLAQEERDLDHAALLRRMRLAASLRHRLAHAALGGNWSPDGDFGDWLRNHSRDVGPFGFTANRHPLISHFGLDRKEATPLALETMLWMYLLRHLEHTQALWYAHGFHAYLLIFCQFQRLLVQQRDQVGFDQFQRITENGLREAVESKYGKRYQQLARSAQGDLDVLEGRFAPKGSHGKAGKLLYDILVGWAEQRPTPGQHRTLTAACAHAGTTEGRRRLRLVAHFIKKEDRTARPFKKEDDAKPSRGSSAVRCRHHALRNDLDRQWHILRRLLERYPGLGEFVSGFDAAANELHAPPEVFAPLFHSIREAGYQHFTYHVGEDFVHLLSGLRAMAEAMEFLELREGNRIGHGTAMGIDVDMWRNAMPTKIVQSRQERLDDLVWARRQLVEAAAYESLVCIDDEIATLARAVYEQRHSPELLYRAWCLRGLDPRAARRVDALRRSGEELPCVLSRSSELAMQRCDKARERDADAFALFLMHHEHEVVTRGLELVEVDAVTTRGPLDGRGLHRLQVLLADRVRQRGVALEVLPTSNVRISLYRRYRDHHIFRWLGLTGERPVPIVLGTDDPGIFATSLRNEYLHILRELDARFDGDADEAIRRIEAIVQNGKRYRFRPLRSPTR